jgi:hypothetical protein
MRRAILPKMEESSNGNRIRGLTELRRFRLRQQYRRAHYYANHSDASPEDSSEPPPNGHGRHYRSLMFAPPTISAKYCFRPLIPCTPKKIPRQPTSPRTFHVIPGRRRANGEQSRLMTTNSLRVTNPLRATNSLRTTFWSTRSTGLSVSTAKEPSSAVPSSTRSYRNPIPVHLSSCSNRSCGSQSFAKRRKRLRSLISRGKK